MDVIEQHSDDKCEKCGSVMDMTRTRYEEDGYDFLQWVCRNEQTCGEISTRHEYHRK